MSGLAILPRTPERRRREASGRWAEHVAAVVLVCKGYRILARRLRARTGEVDIVAVRGRTVAFVEVKLRRSIAEARMSIGRRQSARMARSAEHWIWTHPHYRDHVISLDTVLVAPWRLPRHERHALERT
jgi:putative endonuclease